MMMVGLDRQVK